VEGKARDHLSFSLSPFKEEEEEEEDKERV
jgi:hypothetical protein